MSKKIVLNGYVLAISTSIAGIEITEAEHQQIFEAMANKPVKDGYYYKLRDDTKTWDEFKIPEEEEE